MKKFTKPIIKIGVPNYTKSPIVPNAEQSNNILCKFRQSTKKRSLTQGFFSTQGPSIIVKPSNKEIDDERILNKNKDRILNNHDTTNYAFKHQRQVTEANEIKRPSSSLAVERATKSVRNSTKQNIQIDIDILSKKLVNNIDFNTGNSITRYFSKY